MDHKRKIKIKYKKLKIRKSKKNMKKQHKTNGSNET